MWHFHHSVKRPHLVQLVQRRRESSMQAEDLIFHQRRQRQQIEQIREVLPDVGVAVFAEALVVEAVDLGDLPGLVVPSQNGHSVLEPHFVANQQCHRLHRVVASVNVVAHEKVVGVWGPASDSEELHQIVELPVDVSADCHRTPHLLHIALLRQDLLRLVAESFHFVLRNWLVVYQLFDLAVQGSDLLQCQQIAHFNLI